jgi:Zn-finger nucleic acid-binding protein
MPDADRQTLRSPNCGAPLPAAAAGTAVECGFCHVASAPAPKAAPAPAQPVIAVMPVAVDAPDAPAFATPCPRCALPLVEGRAGEVVLRGCGGCGGVWLDNESARHALNEPATGAIELAKRASGRASRHPDRVALVRCPTCRATLGRVAHPTGLEIDVCPAHGTWFDGDELARVLEAAHPHAKAPAAPWVEYQAATPDFRKGANPELGELARIFATGALSLMGAVGAGVAAVEQPTDRQLLERLRRRD